MFSISLLALPAKAETIQICGIKGQGQILSGYAPHLKKIAISGKDIKISKDGRFIFAFERDDVLEHKITAKSLDGKTIEYNFPIEVTKWDIQNLKGVEQKKVTPSKKDQAEIERERTDIRGAQKETTDELFWQKGFIIPVEGRTSGRFGGQRIMNGKKMNPHMGMDIAVIEGTPVKAPADGIVTLSSNNNYFYSGNVVIIDHGYGLYTIYAHLKDATIKTGSKVKKGDIIGTVGKTGRVTGAHLHWGASLNGVRFDPYSLINKNNFCFNL